MVGVCQWRDVTAGVMVCAVLLSFTETLGKMMKYCIEVLVS